jgi:hypothetical protein
MAHHLLFPYWTAGAGQVEAPSRHPGRHRLCVDPSESRDAETGAKGHSAGSGKACTATVPNVVRRSSRRVSGLFRSPCGARIVKKLMRRSSTVGASWRSVEAPKRYSLTWPTKRSTRRSRTSVARCEPPLSVLEDSHPIAAGGRHSFAPTIVSAIGPRRTKIQSPASLTANTEDNSWPRSPLMDWDGSVEPRSRS